MKPNELPPQVQLMNFIVGKWISKPIYVAAELCMADLLSEGPKSIDELAKQSRSHAPSLYRMMRALASVGIFSETESKRFELTPMAECLKKDAMRSFALMFNSDWSDKAWGQFFDCIKTGETPFEKAFGEPVSEWLEHNPKAAEVFNEANAIKSLGTIHAIIDTYDFSIFNTLTDVGGGLGVLMAEILKANPLMKGVVAEIPSVINKAKKIIREQSLDNRCQAVECDFFESIPSGSDAYLMSNILHDWSEKKCQIILKNCYKAMKPGSKLLIVEMVISDGNEPSIAKLLDLEMFVTTGGQERSEFEYQNLLESSGFKLLQIIPTKESICVIEAIRQ
ncbi:MAG: methyltransferase [candidate division Zixibacteria bacterium]|nr:methyltransferase [candidate division Zixibacteria bacterium]